MYPSEFDVQLFESYPQIFQLFRVHLRFGLLTALLALHRVKLVQTTLLLLRESHCNVNLFARLSLFRNIRRMSSDLIRS